MYCCHKEDQGWVCNCFFLSFFPPSNRCIVVSGSYLLYTVKTYTHSVCKFENIRRESHLSPIDIFFYRWCSSIFTQEWNLPCSLYPILRFYFNICEFKKVFFFVVRIGVLPRLDHSIGYTFYFYYYTWTVLHCLYSRTLVFSNVPYSIFVDTQNLTGSLVTFGDDDVFEAAIVTGQKIYGSFAKIRAE